MEKRCAKCQIVKPVSEFGKDKLRLDGLFPYCKRCRLTNPERHDEWKENTAKGLHHCGRCKEWLNPSEFYPNPSKKTGIHHYCKRCTIEQAKEYYHADKNRAYQKNRNRYWNNKEKEQAEYKAWYTANAERVKEKTRNWHKNNYHKVRSQRLANAKIWRKTNGKKWYEYYKNTPNGRFSIQKGLQNRRARIKSTKNTLTKEEWFEILESQDYTCLRCHRKFSDDLKPTMDHIVPVSKGGGLTKENTQALCRFCNSSKQDKIIDYRSQSSS